MLANIQRQRDRQMSATATLLHTDDRSSAAPTVSDPNNSILAGYLTPEQLAAELGVCERTLTRWHVARVGPPRLTIGRRLLYRRIAVEEWLRRREKCFDEVDRMERRRARR